MGEAPAVKIFPTHTCFNDAFDYMSQRFKQDRRSAKKLILVHAICLAPEGPQKDQPFAHAWVEEGDGAYQDGFLETGERITYQLTVEQLREWLRPQKQTRYTIPEVLVENERSGHFGPWVEEYRALCGRGDRTVFRDSEAAT
jgi:hypothetical protein